MSEYRNHPPPGGGSHHGSDRGPPPRHYQPLPDHYSAENHPTSPHGSYTAHRDQDYGRRYAPHDSMPRSYYKGMDATVSTQVIPSISSLTVVASFPQGGHREAP